MYHTASHDKMKIITLHSLVGSYIMTINRGSTANEEGSMTVVGEDRDMNASVTSSYSFHASHADRVVINRLRIGHTRLTNSYLLKGENQPECQACQYALTVKHILIDCTHLSAVRQRYFRVDTLKELCEIVDSGNIIAFIKDVNIYHCI